MYFTIATEPTTEPVTIQDVEAQSQLGTILDDQRGIVTQMIRSARRYVESRLKRQLITATWTAYLDSFPSIIEIRDKLPMSSLTSIVYTDSNGDSQTLSSSLYQVDFATPNRPGRIMPAVGQSWPTTRTDTFNAVTLTLVAGYGVASAVPDNIKQAIVMLVASSYENREATISGVSISKVPLAVDDLLAASNWGWYG